MKNILIFAVVLTSLNSIAQTNVSIEFPPKVGNNDLVLNTTVQDLNGVDMIISDFNYYISNIRIFHDGGQETAFIDSVYLIKAEDNGVYLGFLPITDIDSVQFGIGVPKNLNHLDISQYPIGHSLSWQNPNMHWGWISGYAIMLCNGLGDSNNDGTADTFFELHNFGDTSYTKITLPMVETVGENALKMVINCNLDQWLYGINPGTVGAVHGTFPVNIAVMDNAKNRAVFTLPGNASLDKEKEDVGSLTYGISSDAITFKWKDLPNVEQYKIIDLTGKIIDEGVATEYSGIQVSQIDNPGSYFFYLLDSNGSILKYTQVIR